MDIQELAEKTFGQECYAGFDSVLRDIEENSNISLSTYDDINKHKWRVLEKAMELHPSITDIHVMSQIIMHILDGKVVYDNEDVDNFEELLESLIP